MFVIFQGASYIRIPDIDVDEPLISRIAARQRFNPAFKAEFADCEKIERGLNLFQLLVKADSIRSADHVLVKVLKHTY